MDLDELCEIIEPVLRGIDEGKELWVRMSADARFRYMNWLIEQDAKIQEMRESGEFMELLGDSVSIDKVRLENLIEAGELENWFSFVKRGQEMSHCHQTFVQLHS